MTKRLKRQDVCIINYKNIDKNSQNYLTIIINNSILYIAFVKLS